jgi:hypothetical protein
LQQKHKSNELSKFAKNTSGNRSAPLEPCIIFLLRKLKDVNILLVSLFTEISSYTWKSRTVGKSVSRAELKLTEEDVWHQQESNVHLSQALTLKMALSKSSVCIPYVNRTYTITALPVG